MAVIPATYRDTTFMVVPTEWARAREPANTATLPTAPTDRVSAAVDITEVASSSVAAGAETTISGVGTVIAMESGEVDTAQNMASEYV